LGTRKVAEIVRIYDTGIIVTGTPEGIAEGLWMLVHAFPQRYVWIRQRARQPVDDHFTWPKVVTCIAHAYRAAVEG
jgi:hypothetical protein